MKPMRAYECETPMTDDDSVYQELVEWLTVKVAEYVNVPPDTIGIDTPLADYGIDSLSGLALCTDLQYEQGFDVDTTIVWDHPTIHAMAEYLVTEGAPP